MYDWPNVKIAGGESHFILRKQGERLQESSTISCDERVDLSITKQYPDKSFANDLRKKVSQHESTVHEDGF